MIEVALAIPAKLTTHAVIYKCDKTEDAKVSDELTKEDKCTKIKEEDDCDDEDE